MNKVTTIEKAMEHVRSGMTIMVGGFMAVGTPEKLVDALLATGVKDLTLVCNDAGVPGRGTGKIVCAGVLKKFYASHIGLNPDCGQRMHSGEIEVILVPQGTLAERIRAAGAGLGGFLTPTGVGTEVENGKQKITIDGRTHLLELPLKGDIALIRAHRADKLGNVVFRKSAQNFNLVMAMACSYVICQADHVEDVGAIDPDHVMLPGVFVHAVVKG